MTFAAKRRSTPALLFFCAAAAAAAASWDGRLTRAESLSGEGRNEEASAEAQGALADADAGLGPAAPELGRVLARVSRVYLAAGASAQFPGLEARLSAASSRDFEILSALGELRREMGKFDEAESAIKKSLELKPGDAGAEDALVRVYEEAGRFEEEIRALDAMIGKSPRDYSRYFALARVYARLGRFEEAKAAYARAKKAGGGKGAAAYVREGYFDLHSGRPARAKEDFESAIAVDTASYRGYHHMGAFLAQSGRYAEAEKYLRRSLEKLEADARSPEEDVLHTRRWLAEVMFQEGRYPEAEAMILENIRRARLGSMWRLNAFEGLAKLYAAQGKTIQAEEVYQRAADECAVRFRCRFEDSGEALTSLGSFYSAHGRRAEAEAAAERTERLCADIPAGRDLFEVLRRLSSLYESLGDVSKNEALYARLMPLRRAMPLNPDLDWVETGLAGIEADKKKRRAP
jgi:tetratricopeptide (TPR) repeat protein